MTTFSIDNILQPEFGQNLKKLSNMVKKPTTSATEKFPAWIYCTRYSDRPSCAGKKNFWGFTKQLNFSIALS